MGGRQSESLTARLDLRLKQATEEAEKSINSELKQLEDNLGPRFNAVLGTTLSDLNSLNTEVAKLKQQVKSLNIERSSEKSHLWHNGHNLAKVLLASTVTTITALAALLIWLPAEPTSTTLQHALLLEQTGAEVLNIGGRTYLKHSSLSQPISDNGTMYVEIIQSNY